MNLGISDYARLVRDRWWLVAMVTLLGVLAAVAVAMIRDRPVSASVDVQVPAYAARDGQSAQDIAVDVRRRVRKYAELAESEQIAAVVAHQLGVGMTADEIRSAVAALYAPDTAMLRLTATDPDPLRAVTIVQAVSMKVAAAGRADGLRPTLARLDDRPQARIVVLASAGVAGGVPGLIVGVFVTAWRDRRR
ncbi:MAG: hypothetical protein LLG14_03680 [Nocardiaceae bacterium]|nr:hypothetical protein [Nocardiaceae bacterium]